jgi:hypothetical protein
MSSTASLSSTDDDDNYNNNNNTIIVSWLLSLAASPPLSDKNELLTSEPEQKMVKVKGKRVIKRSPEEHSSKRLRITGTSQTFLTVAENVSARREVLKRMALCVDRLEEDIAELMKDAEAGWYANMLFERHFEDLRSAMIRL